VEAMISMVILAVGILAIISMQTASVSVSQDLTHALNLGERTLELLRLDALRWNTTTDLATETLMLAPALPGTQAVGAQGPWMAIPDNVVIASMGGKKVDRNFAPDTQGAPDWPLGFRYCLHYRLTWVNPPTALRADARVAWAKEAGIQSRLADCVADRDNVTDTANVRSVTVSSTLMMNVTF
jgi:hypothetical protein